MDTEFEQLKEFERNVIYADKHLREDYAGNFIAVLHQELVAAYKSFIELWTFLPDNIKSDKSLYTGYMPKPGEDIIP